jgi:hypothetical protein
MNDTDRLGVSAPAYKSFRESNPDLFENYRFDLDWLPKPVMVVTIAGDTITNNGKYAGVPSLGLPLVKAIKLTGFTPRDANYAEIARYPGNHRFPRNLKWNQMPMISEPLTRQSFHKLDGITPEGHLDRADGIFSLDAAMFSDPAAYRIQSRVIEGVRGLVISCDKLTGENLRVATAVYDQIGEQEFPVVVHFDGTDSRVVSFSEVIAVRDKFVAQERFIYNHMVNLSIMGGRALFKLAHENQMSKGLAKRLLPRFDDLSWQWSHPLVIQTLHLLKNEGRVSGKVGPGGDSALREVNFQQQPFVFANGLPIFEKVEDRYQLNWKGSGKYPAWILDLGVVHDYSNGGPEGTVAPHTHPIFGYFGNLIMHGLIALTEGQITLTSDGLKFLAYLGPETDDADLLVRWRTASGEWGTSDDIPTMDRWMNRAFRAMKRRVASLPASPMTEEDAPPLVLSNEGDNVLAIRGLLFPVNDELMRNKDVAEFVAKIASAERGTLLQDLRMGTIIEMESLGADPKILGIWIGVPVGVFDRADIAQDRVCLFRDTSVADDVAIQLIARVPAALQPFANREIDLITIVRTDRPPCRYLPLPLKIEISDGDVVGDVVKGQVLVVEDLKAFDDGLFSHAEMQDYYRKQGNEPQTDGLRFHGEISGKMVISHGILVGRVNFTTGKQVVERKFGGSQLNDLNKRFIRDRSMFSRFFNDEKISQDGVWAIRPDGRIYDLSKMVKSGS